MQELLNDPETLPFIEEQQVHLPKLKNQIDRRMLKIIALIENRHKKHHQKSNKQIMKNQMHQYVQTESLPILQNTPYRHSLDTNVLSPSAKFNPNLPSRVISQDMSEKKDKKIKNNENKIVKHVQRPLRIHRPQTLSYEQSDFLKQESALLESNGFTFRRCERSINQSSVDFGDMEEIPEDKFFNKEDFPMKLSCIEMCSKNKQQNHRNPHYIDINIKDNTKSELSRMSFNTEISHRSGGNQIYCSQKRFMPSKTRRKMTDMSLLESEEHRIQVSNQCMEKMNGEVLLLVNRRRKQFWDSKIRMNMLKKIEEKYSKDIYDS